MVRLKRTYGKLHGNTNPYLHSIMVRLKHIEDILTREFIKKFTFHYGKIKTPNIFLMSSLLTYLHSIMVRLKQVPYKPRYFPKLSHPKLSTS